MRRKFVGVSLLIVVLVVGPTGLTDTAEAQMTSAPAQVQRYEPAQVQRTSSSNWFRDSLKKLFSGIGNRRPATPPPAAPPTTVAPPRPTTTVPRTGTTVPRVAPTLPSTTTQAPSEPTAPITDEDEEENPVAPAPDNDLLSAGEVQSIMQMSGVIKAGRQFFQKNESFRSSATRIAPSQGYYTIAMHGPTPENVRIGSTRYTAKQWAQVIKADPNWRGQNLKFVTCNIGSEPDGFAQQLADQLGVKVMAANTLVWMSPNGKYYATDGIEMANGSHRPVVPYNGKWLVFSPRKT